MDTDDDTLVEAILNITNINLSMRLLCLLERICRIDALIQTIINNQTTISEFDPINYELQSRIQDPLGILSSNNPLDILGYYNLI